MLKRETFVDAMICQIVSKKKNESSVLHPPSLFCTQSHPFCTQMHPMQNERLIAKR